MAGQKTLGLLLRSAYDIEEHPSLVAAESAVPKCTQGIWNLKAQPHTQDLMDIP